MKLTDAKELMRKKNQYKRVKEITVEKSLAKILENILEDFKDEIYFNAFTYSARDLCETWRNGVYVDLVFHKSIKNPVIRFFKGSVESVIAVRVKGNYTDDNLLQSFDYHQPCNDFLQNLYQTKICRLDDETSIARFVVFVAEQLELVKQ